MDAPVTQPSPTAAAPDQEQDDMNTLKQLAGIK
jgi:hypothetical protein